MTFRKKMIKNKLVYLGKVMDVKKSNYERR